MTTYRIKDDPDWAMGGVLASHFMRIVSALGEQQVNRICQTSLEKRGLEELGKAFSELVEALESFIEPAS